MTDSDATLIFSQIGFPIHPEYSLRTASPEHRLRFRETISVRLIVVCLFTSAVFAKLALSLVRLATLTMRQPWQLWLALWGGMFAIGLVGTVIVRRRLRRVGDLAVFDDARQSFVCVGLIFERLEELHEAAPDTDIEIERHECAIPVRAIRRLRLIEARAKSKGFATLQNHIRFVQLVLDRTEGDPVVIAASEGRAKSLRRIARRLASLMDLPLEVVRVPKHLMPSAQQFEGFLRPRASDIRRAYSIDAAIAEAHEQREEPEDDTDPSEAFDEWDDVVERE